MAQDEELVAAPSGRYSAPGLKISWQTDGDKDVSLRRFLLISGENSFAPPKITNTSQPALGRLEHDASWRGRPQVLSTVSSDVYVRRSAQPGRLHQQIVGVKRMDRCVILIGRVRKLCTMNLPTLGGATVIFRFHRQRVRWLGGLGLFPAGMGTIHLGRAENPGVPWPVPMRCIATPLAREVGFAPNGPVVGMFYSLARRAPCKPARRRLLRHHPHPRADPTHGTNRSRRLAIDAHIGGNRSTVIIAVMTRGLRRHAQPLADAGVDTLIFDTTNAQTYPAAYRALCAVFRCVRQAGGRTPQIAFMVNTRAGETAQQIYDDLYRPGEYAELWFRWQGKPLMICDPAAASAELKEFFTLRRAHWPFTLVNTPYAWHWEAIYPQPYGYTEDPAKPEQLTVSVAQNLRQKMARSPYEFRRGADGFPPGPRGNRSGAVNHGYNFEQWQHALALTPPFVMVTGWNEWIAGRWGKWDGPLTFVDQFDQENSRDIEPAAVGRGTIIIGNWCTSAGSKARRRCRGVAAPNHPH